MLQKNVNPESFVSRKKERRYVHSEWSPKINLKWSPKNKLEEMSPKTEWFLEANGSPEMNGPQKEMVSIKKWFPNF